MPAQRRLIGEVARQDDEDAQQSGNDRELSPPAQRIIHQAGYGRYIDAAASNREATRRSGVNIGRAFCLAYIISSVLAALAGMLASLAQRRRAPHCRNHLRRGQDRATHVSLATVYNTLNQSVHFGLLGEMIVPGEKTHHDSNTGEHAHFFFENTQSILDSRPDSPTVDRPPKPPQVLRSIASNSWCACGACQTNSHEGTGLPT